MTNKKTKETKPIMIISGKEYELNKDGTPSFIVSLAGEETLIRNVIKPSKQFYEFKINNFSEDSELLFIISDGNSLNKKDLAAIFLANLKNIPIHMFSSQSKKTSLLDTISTLTEVKNTWEYYKNEEELGKKIRSYIAKRSYGLKLKSDGWKKLCVKVKEAAEYKCQLCNIHKIDSILIVHHRSYSRVGTPDEIKDLICLCKKCHSLVHDNINFT